MASAKIRHVVQLVILVSGIVLSQAPSYAQFKLYDDFSSGTINPEKWSGRSVEGNNSQPTTETLRIVEDGKLRLRLVSWGGTASDSGSVSSRQGLQLTQLGTPGGSKFITGLRAQVTILTAEAQDCAANPEATTPARGRVMMLGSFFNDGTGGPADATGNITAALSLQKEKDGSNVIVGFLSRCSDAACVSGPLIAMPGNPVTFTTAWSVGTPLILKLVWHDADAKFEFVVTDPATGHHESHTIVYLGTVTNAGPPTSFDFKQIRVFNTAENCTVARKHTLMDAFFDKVMVRRAQ